MPGIPIRVYNHVLALANDPGLCGIVLRKVPPKILSAAAKRDDTWDFLLGVRDVPKDFLQFCRAAKSAGYGAKRLARMARGSASGRTDWQKKYDEAVSKGHRSEIERLQKRLVLNVEGLFPGALETSAPTELRALVAKTVAGYRGRFARKIGGQKLNEVWKTSPKPSQKVMEKYPREWLLITGWLRLPEGDPGLCFYSKPALAKLFQYFGFGETESCDYRNRLHRLGLVQGPVFILDIEKREDGLIDLLLPSGAKHLLRTRLEIGSRVRYKGGLHLPLKPSSILESPQVA
jgi:hypothetical protein